MQVRGPDGKPGAGEDEEDRTEDPDAAEEDDPEGEGEHMPPGKKGGV